MATATKYFNDKNLKRFVSQKGIGYTVVAGYLIFVLECVVELQDGSTTTVYQLNGLGNATLFNERPTIDRPTRIAA